MNMLLDLLTVDPHTPTSEPVRYDKKDGQWYTHDGVDVKDTQQRKGEFSHINFIGRCLRSKSNFSLYYVLFIKHYLLPGLEIATHWSPMRPKLECWRLGFQNWSPAGDSHFVR